MLKTFIFTFGSGQDHEFGYHVIKAPTETEAREIMFQRFGNNWSFCYDSIEAAGVWKYGLEEVVWTEPK